MQKAKHNQFNNISRFLRGELGLLLILVLLCIVFSAATPYFLKEKNLLNVTRQISIVLIVALGMLSVVLSGEIDLSVGSTAALSGIACAYVIIHTGSQPLGILAAIAIGIIVGVINGSLVVFGKMPSFIVTLAMMGIVRGIGMVWTQGKPISNLPQSFSFLGAKYIFGKVPVSTIVSLILVLIFYIVLQRTKHGTYIKAIGSNVEVAILSTIPIKRYKLLVFVASGFVCAVGGIITTSKLLSAQPTASDGLEMDVLSGVILGGASLSGGIGTVMGTLIGTLIIGVTNNGMNLMNISPFYQQIVKGIIIIIAVLIKQKNKTK